MSRLKEILAIALALIGWLTAIFTCLLPMWKVYVQPEGIARTGQAIWEGLWMNCVIRSSGQMQCKAHDSMQAPSPDLQLARDMIVIAIITAVLPLTTSIMGAKCTNCIKDKASKVKVMIFSGCFFIIAGCLVLIPVYWIRNTIIHDSFVSSHFHKEIGASLLFGFAAAALLICGGLLLCLTCPSWERRVITPPDNQPAKSTTTVGFALAAIGWILAIVTCFLPMWIVATSSEYTTSIGLWMVCVKQSTGQSNCQSGLSLQDSGSSELKNVYVLTLCSIVMPLEILINYIRKSNGFIYITLFIKIKASQRNCIIMCGVYSIIAGIFLVIPVAEVANIISYLPEVDKTHDYYSGASIYIGFTAAALYGIGGVLLCCACYTEEGQ